MNKAIAAGRRYWKPLIGLNGVIVTATVCSATLSPRSWTASTQLILPDSTTNLDASLGPLGQLKDQGVAFTNELNPLKIQASILMSDDVIRPVWSSDLERDKFTSLETYKKVFKVKPVDQSTTIQVQAEGPEPELAQKRAERLITAYQKRLNELRQGTADNRQQFNQRQLVQAERDLVQAKNRLAQFKLATGLVDSEEQTKNLVQAINTLTTTQVQTLAQGRGSADRAGVLSQRLRMSPRQAMNALRLSENKEYQAVRQKLTEVDASLASMRGSLTDESPPVKALLLRRAELVSSLKARMAAVVPDAENVDISFGGNNSRDVSADLISQLVEAESESQGYRQQSAQIEAQVAQLKQSLRAIATQQAELSELQRRFDIAEGIYKGIVAQAQQAKISAFNAYPNVQVLDSPSVDPKPTSPKRSLIAIGGIIAALFGSAAAIAFLESRNTLLKPKDILAMETPVLIRIPHLNAFALARTSTEVPAVEFHRLASTISLNTLKKQRLMVTSSTSGEGKTTTTLGLARALVDFGFRVLMVDGDFRKAELSRRLGYGVRRDVQTVPQTVQVSPGLDLLPAILGLDSRVMEYVARGRFEQHLNLVQSTGNYDYVVIDSAPAGLTGETALMARAVSNVLLVVRMGLSDRHMVQETLEQLMRHNATIVGLAMNGTEQRSDYVYKPSNSPARV